MTISTLLAAGCSGEPESPAPVATEPAPAKPIAVTPAPDPAPAAAAARPDATAVDTALDAAQQYLDSDDLPKAEAVLAVLLEKAPRDARAHELLGQILVRRGVMARAAGDAEAAAAANAEAYEHYTLALEVDPESAGLHQSAGVVAQAAGLPEEALAHYRRAAEIDPRQAQYPLYAAQVLIEDRRYDEAIETLEVVIVLDPDEPLAHASMAIVALEQDRHDDALGHIAEARRIVPSDLRFRAQEARIHRRRGAPERGVELLQALDGRARTTEIVATELAACYAALDQHGQAAIVWEQRFRAMRGNPAAYREAVRAGRAYLRDGAIEPARGLLSEAKVLAWNAPEVKQFEDEFVARSAAEPGK
ncbi:MAG: tetratricopeptide repeat protein [Planctomycetes bacterium]|nr:tetratricopeptide repeat protein [Planctomycetota bacterium]